MGFFLQRAFRMIFPKKVKLHKGIIIAQYARTGDIPRKRKAPDKKPAALPLRYDNRGKKCA